MSFVKKIILAILFATSLLSLNAQTGTISGTITNKKDDGTIDTIKYAKVLVDSTPHRTFSKIGGLYILPNIPVGTYTVVASYRELKRTVTDIVVKSGDTTFLPINLTFSAVKGDAITFTYTKKKKDETVLTAEKINTDVVADIIGKTELKERSSGSDVASNAKVISGVSVVGGKYVYIRGLSDRYSKTMLNNSEIPGLDPNKNSVQLDMFPNTFISSLKVLKTYSPDLPGDWAGGLLDLRTNEYPDSFTVSLKVGGSINTQTSFQSNFNTYEGGKKDFLGFDDGTRQLPDYIQKFVDNGTMETFNKSFGVNLTEKDLATKSFNKVMQSTTKTSLPNSNISLTIGNKYKWNTKKDTTLSRTFGYFAGGSYSKSYSYFDGGEKGKYFMTGSIFDTELQNSRQFDWTKSSESVLVGSLFNMKYIHNKRNNIGFNYIHNHTGESSVSIVLGEEDQNDGTFRNESLKYLQRGMNSIQLYGEHKLINPDSVKLKSKSRSDKTLTLDWTASYTKAKQDEPDLRFITSRHDFENDSAWFIANDNAPARFFRSMNESNYDTKINLTYPIEIDSAKFLEFKVGISNVTKSREFRENRMDLDRDQSDLYNGNMYDFLSNDNIGIANTSRNEPLFYINGFQERNNYDGYSSISAGYFKIKVPFTDKLSLIGGVRDEYTNIIVESQKETLEEGLLVRNDILPSVNLNYSIWNNVKHIDKIDSVKTKRTLKLRLGYNRTLARPNFRELAPYETDDFDLKLTIGGDPTLDRTLIDNLDMRLEYYPRKGETFSVSGFYKKFTNPIELLGVIGTLNQFNWSQVPSANLYGAEFEFKKKLDFIDPSLHGVRIGSNVTLVKSAVDIPEAELANIRIYEPDHKDTRPLFGQSPYLINAFIQLKPDTAKQDSIFKTTRLSKITRGTSFTLNYNVFGERVVLVTRQAPDVYEMPRHSLNLNISKQFTKKLKLSLKLNNLLNPAFEKLYRFKGKDEVYEQYKDEEYIFSSYKKGVSGSGSLTYVF